MNKVLVILQLDLACLDLLALEGRLRGFQRSLLLFEQVEQFRAVDRGNEIALLNRVPAWTERSMTPDAVLNRVGLIAATIVP